MEMHQIRYFLAVARTLNFTRAAEECNVSQPSLTRAIKNLENELGDELFRRERASSHLTPLGRSMLPLLTQCYESALTARGQAESMKKGDVAPLRIVLSQTIDFDLVADALVALEDTFGTLQLACPRNDAVDIVPRLRSGEAEIALAGPLDDSWDRLDSWALFSEKYRLVVRDDHPLADRDGVTFDDLSGERVIVRPYCEQWPECRALLNEHGLEPAQWHEVACDEDVVRLLEAGLGVGLVPTSMRLGERLRCLALENLMERTVRLYAVAGRQRSPALTGFINLLRSADWSSYDASA